MQSKECSLCKKPKALTSYYKDKHQPLGVRSACKECEAVKRAETKKRKNLIDQTSLPEAKRQKLEEPVNVKGEQPSKQEKVNDAMQLSEGPIPEHVCHTLHGDVPIETSYPPFDFESCFEKGKHYSVSVIGSRNSGKSTLLVHTWPFYKSRYDLMILFCNTLNADIYNEMLTEQDRELAFDEFTPQILRDLTLFNKLTKNSIHIGFYFDDCSDMSFTKNNNDILQLYITGRNKNMSVYYSTQSAMFINRNSRENTDFCFLLRCRTPQMKETVIEQYVQGIIPVPAGIKSKSDKQTYYSDWLTVNTVDRQIVVIDFLHNDTISKFKLNLPSK